MQSYINTIIELVGELATAGRPLEEEEISFEILCGLPEEYEPDWTYEAINPVEGCLLKETPSRSKEICLSMLESYQKATRRIAIESESETLASIATAYTRHFEVPRDLTVLFKEDLIRTIQN